MPQKYFNLDTQLEVGISNNLTVSPHNKRNSTNLTNMELMEKYGINPWLRLSYYFVFRKDLKMF